jgi:hypothetical protein
MGAPFIFRLYGVQSTNRPPSRNLFSKLLNPLFRLSPVARLAVSDKTLLVFYYTMPHLPTPSFALKLRLKFR